MTTEQLDGYLKLAADGAEIAAKATEGSWIWSGSYVIRKTGMNKIEFIRTVNGKWHDCHFIADARTRLPQLCEAVAAMAEEVRRLKAILKISNDAVMVRIEETVERINLGLAEENAKLRKQNSPRLDLRFISSPQRS